MTTTRFVVAVLCVALLAIAPSPAMGQSNPSQPRPLTLAAAIHTALANNPVSRAEDLQVLATQQRLRRLQAYRRIPTTKLTADTGVVPDARGDIFFSPDNADSISGIGPFIKLEFGFVVPLYTFGQLGHVQEAAAHGVEARSQQRDVVRNQLALQVAKTYYAIAATRKVHEIAQDMQSQYDKLTDEVHRRYEEEPEGYDLIDETDVLEIDANRFQVDGLVLESANGVHLATSALNTLLGRDPAAPVGLASEGVLEIHIDESSVADLVRMARNRNPQARALMAAEAGLASKLQAQHRKSLPGLFLVGGVGYARAPDRTDQKNPFVLDNFNFFRAGAQVRITWDLNFAHNRIEATRIRLERDSTRMRREALSAKLYAEVDKATRKVLLSQQLLDGARKSQVAARSWLRLALDNWELGIGEVKRLLDAYRAYYALRVDVVQRELAVTRSIAELAFAVGDLNLYLKWVANGQVSVD